MMTTLQIVLAIVGISLIAIIVIYNVLQERKFRKEADRMFSQKRDDIMLGESVRSEATLRRSETHIQLNDDASHAREARQAVDQAEAALPVVGFDEPNRSDSTRAKPVGGSILTFLEPVAAEPAPPIPAPQATPVAAPMPEPAVQAVAPPPRPAAPVPPPAFLMEDEHEEAAPAPRASNLDAATEYIARLKFSAPTLANFGPVLSTLRRIGKPVRVFGQRPDGAWEALSSHPRNTYAQVEFGLQMADRGGALSRDQLDAFCRALYEFTAEEGGAVTCPDKDATLAAARDLDLFCMGVDVLIGLNVVSADSRPFTSEAMHGLAQEARLALEPDGTFQARDDFGHVLFTLANQEEAPFPRDGRGLTTHGVTLLFDVPRVADGLVVFDRMTRLGQDLAWRLEGRLVDDNSRAVNDDSLNRDRARLAQYYATMEARGIPAGGERALRLFV
ncbi:MAG: cell division protein ZipA C-terminal FtsZ-binding domain-containing protein [Pseudomonadota bacterium]